MGDRTLIEADIRRFAKECQLLNPFSEGQLRQCFYDFRVGSKIVYAHPQGHIQVSLSAGEGFTLKPGEVCTVYSLEEVHMPLNMKGRLALRGTLGNRQILYRGGPINPGYKGHLFFTLINVGGAPVTVSYGDGIVTGEFVQLEGEVETEYSRETYHDIPRDRLPLRPRRQLYDWVELTEKIDLLDSQYQTVRHDVKVSSILTNTVLLSAVAGVVAGIVIILLQLPPMVSLFKRLFGM